MDLRDLNIKNRINFGFIIIISISVFINIYLLNEISRISQNIDYLYQHPFIVSNTSHEIKADLIALPYSLMQINASKNQKTFFNEKENLAQLKNNIQDAFDILKERYLGDKKDLQSLAISLERYKVLENELFNYFAINKWAAADSTIKNRLKPIINELSDKNNIILQFAMNKGKSYLSESIALQYKIFINTLLLMILSFLSTILIAVLIVRSINRPLKSIIEVTRQMAMGNLKQRIEKDGRDEITLLMSTYESMQHNLINNARIAEKISNGDFSGTLEPQSEQDELAISINKMTRSLRKMTSEKDKQTWLQQGQNELHECMRGDQEMTVMASGILKFLCHYLNAKPGALYLFNSNENCYELISSYAYTFRKGNNNRFKPGESLVGQAALEQKMLVISELPENYMKIQSALGDIAPRAITVVPFVFQNKTIGVMEFGHLKDPEPHELSFLQIVMEAIAINFNMALSRSELKNLLDITRQQSEMLRIKQEEMLQTNEELEQQTKALKNSEEHLQTQQEELRVINEELEENSVNLKMQQEKLLDKNKELEIAQKDVERKAAELERTSKYKSEFLANMSHELRTPLNSLLILSQDLINNSEGNLTTDQIESSTIIYKSGNDLLQLINEILDLSKIESGKLELNIHKTEVSEIITAITNSFKKQIEEKGLEFKTGIDPDAPESFISDTRRVDQIIKNLMSNAIKFTAQGKIILTVQKPSAGSLKRLTGPVDRYIAFRVADSGIGIAEDMQEKIFGAFQQADGSISRKYGGTGLGLSISREMAHLLGGEIILSSEPGNGSEFTLILPLEYPVIEQTKKEHDKPSRTNDIALSKEIRTADVSTFKSLVNDDRQNATGNDPVILLIEDDATFAKVLIDQCHRKGFKCISAPTGEEGLHLASEHQPSAIILDIKLPGMDGWNVIEALKNNAKTRHIPVHMMSAFGETIEAYRKGAIGYLTKPVKPEDLDNAFGEIQHFIQRKMRELLIIEDDANLRQTIRKIIGHNDIIITDASTAQDAIQHMHDHSFDCIVLDLGLPDMSGFELLKKLEAEKIKIPPVIVYTGRELTSVENEELQNYSNSIIIKGVKSEERLLDETALFLHRVIDQLPNKQKSMIINLYDKDKIFMGKNILIVDDDMRNVFALTKVLEQIGMNVHKADNGLKALHILTEKDTIDLVLMDIMMPVMNGYEAIGKIREQNKFKKLPVIALTAKAMKEDQARCIAAGANDYIAKPVNLERLFSLMRVWLY